MNFKLSIGSIFSPKLLSISLLTFFLYSFLEFNSTKCTSGWNIKIWKYINSLLFANPCVNLWFKGFPTKPTKLAYLLGTVKLSLKLITIPLYITWMCSENRKNMLLWFHMLQMVFSSFFQNNFCFRFKKNSIMQHGTIKKKSSKMHIFSCKVIGGPRKLKRKANS